MYRLSYKEESYLVAKEILEELPKYDFINDSLNRRIFISTSCIDRFLDKCLLRRIKILSLEGFYCQKELYEKLPLSELKFYDVKARNWSELIEKIIKKIKIEFNNWKKSDCNYIYFTLQKRKDGYPCPCCGFLTRSESNYGTYEICPICGWEDDNVQAEKPEFEGGANKESLNEARDNYKKYGASAQRYIKQVRSPNEDEIPDEEE